MPKFLLRTTIYSEKFHTIEEPLRLETETQGHQHQQGDKQKQIIAKPLFLREECEEGWEREGKRKKERGRE